MYETVRKPDEHLLIFIIYTGWSVSQPHKLSVRLPAIAETGFQMLSCNYVTLKDSDDRPVKMIAVSWDFKVFKDIVTIKSFVIEWKSSLGGDPGRLFKAYLLKFMISLIYC